MVGAFTLALFRSGDPGLSIMKTEPDICRFFLLCSDELRHTYEGQLARTIRSLWNV